MESNRREFLKKTSVMASGMGLMPGIALTSCAPSDQINGAVIGCRSQGFNDMKRNLWIRGVNCIAWCDVDHKVLDNRVA